MLENIRLNTTEKNALLHAISDVKEEVYILGSRLDLTKKGGDIDMLVFSGKPGLELSQEISRSFFLICEEKIDVLVFDKNNLSPEQKAFLNTIRKIRIK